MLAAVFINDVVCLVFTPLVLDVTGILGLDPSPALGLPRPTKSGAPTASALSVQTLGPTPLAAHQTSGAL